MMVISKYEELARFLEKQDPELLRMSFDEIEKVIEGPLPKGAREYRAWWANSETNNHAVNGWLNVGWETSQVDMEKGELVFIRAQQVFQDSLIPGYMPKTKSRRTGFKGQSRMDSELEIILRQVGGLANLSHLIDAVERYIRGDLQEIELGQELRRLWARKR